VSWLARNIVIGIVLGACSDDHAIDRVRDASIARDVGAGGPRAEDAGAPGLAPPLPPFMPELEPNRWTLVRDDLPFAPLETGVAYDPRAHALVQHGGHVASSYPQSSYTTIFTIRDGVFRDSLAPLRPMRRCIVELGYLDGPERIVTVQGAAEHGTLPRGELIGYRIERSDARGPWLLDVIGDRWEQARPSGAQWPRRTFASHAYDAASDALYVVGSDALIAYVAHANEILALPMPEAMRGLRSYAMAFDPDTRRLVIFGGATRAYYYGHIDGDETDNCGAVDAETCAAYYRQYVRGDTWILDVEEAARAGWPEAASDDSLPTGWHRAEGEGPPRGMATAFMTRLQMVFHPPSGRMLLLQHAIDDAPIERAEEWPAIDLWALDPASESWSRIETEDRPHFAGLAAWASGEDALFVWGGGSVGEARATDSHAMLSKSLYVVRPAITGVATRAAARVARVRVESVDAGEEVRFSAEPGVEYEIARAPATPIAGAYETIGTVRASTAEASFVDVESGGDDSRHAYRARPVGEQRWSMPGFAAPYRPSGLHAVAHHASEVALGWDRSPDADVVGYHVYRWGASESRTRITSSPIAETSWVDRSVDLSDGLAHAYVVTVVDRAGRESGPSPAAYTLPDAPESLDVRELPDGRFEIDWAPRDAAHERLEVRYLDYHCNARSSIETFLDTFAPVSSEPLSGDRITVTAPVIDPALRVRAPAEDPGECARTLRDGHYFYARVVNALGQPGFYSDIVSPHDERFRAAVVPRP
jgi:hypothetical protein